MSFSLEQLASQVTEWCARHGVVPANGQVAADTTVRTLRYYRTLGLLDAALEGGGSGYTQHHYLQAAAVRVLQGQGLPLTRIQSLLFGRSDEELQGILDTVEGGGGQMPETENPKWVQPETWQTWPVSPEFLLISRRPGVTLTADQLEAIRLIIQA